MVEEAFKKTGGVIVIVPVVAMLDKVAKLPFGTVKELKGVPLPTAPPIVMLPDPGLRTRPCAPEIVEPNVMF